MALRPQSVNGKPIPVEAIKQGPESSVVARIPSTAVPGYELQT